MKPIRAFFAIDLEPKVRDLMERVILALKKTSEGKKVSWIWAKNLHITVRFLGDIKPTQSLALMHQVTKTIRGLPPFKIEFGPVGLFPSRHKPHVIAADIVYSQALQNLFNAVENAIIAAGFPPETRPARPHLTIARLRGRNIPDLEFDLSSTKTSMLVDEIVLYQSEPNKYGSTYIPLQRIKLL